MNMIYGKGLKVLLVFCLMVTLGFSWTAGYNNRVEINATSIATSYNGVAVPIPMNSTVLGSNPCQDTNWCNDSLVTDLSDNPLYYYIQYYNASDTWTLYVNMTAYGTTPTPIYFYFNNTVLTRSSYQNGNKVFLRFNDFENYTNNTKVSSDFGVFSLRLYIHIHSPIAIRVAVAFIRMTEMAWSMDF